MENRIKVQEVQPALWKAMYQLSNALADIQLSKIQRALIMIRASQINGCAFCMDMHTKEALQQGETQQRIFVLSAWRETSLFSEEEQVLLAMTEEITLIGQQGLTDATYAKAAAVFSGEVIAQIILSIVVINGWNRIAVSTHMPVGK